MSCKGKGHDFDVNCVCDVVRFINDLQDAVDNDDLCPESCLRPQLGGVANNNNRANTRPFILYTKSGEPFEAFFDSGNAGKCTSPFFRVESVDGCCAVLRVLTISRGPEGNDNQVCFYFKQRTNPGNPVRLVRTDQCVVVDLNCFCAIQCLEDLYVEGV